MVKKKIGCVIAYTPGHTNYGTSLVGYALLRKLQTLGFELEVINYKKRLSCLQKVLFIINAIRAGELKELLLRINSKRMIKRNPQYAVNINERVKAVEAYKERKLIPFFHDYEGFNALQKGSENYDVIVVGSDQVWTPMSLPNKFFNLLFVNEKVRKVAYASSFGVYSIPSFQKKATGAYLDRFYSIGVREQRGKEIVESLSHNKATVVADPTLLLDAHEWGDEISNDSSKGYEIPQGPYIFCYFLGTNTEGRNAAIELKKKTDYLIVTLRHMDEYYEPDEQFGDEYPYNVDPNCFLRLIKGASYVCTDSFHCTAFCIQFHKKFMTFYRFAQTSKTGRNSRIDSLFHIAGISPDHLFTGNIFNIENEIDWRQVDLRIAKLRNDSLSFLEQSLK